MAWVFLFFAGIAEIFFSVFLRLSDQFTRFTPTCLFIFFAGLSFFLMAKAIVTIHIGVAYAVWSGIGILGTVVMGVILFGEPIELLKIIFLGLLIISIIGLKIIG